VQVTAWYAGQEGPAYQAVTWTAHIFTQKARTHTKCYAAASPH